MNSLLISLGKSVSFMSKTLSRGSGSTWPGHIALSANKNFVKEILRKNPNLKTILIVGTNGKTTTGKMVRTILETAEKRAFQNEAGANLLNGIASSLLLNSNPNGKIPFDFAIFEVDENSLPLVVNEFMPNYIIILNLFRDQLDRYGEVNTIAKKWKKTLKDLPSSTVVIANGDDPLIAQIAQASHENAYYFGLDEPKLSRKENQHASDTTYCPNCGNKLKFKQRYLSHLGNWECTKCNRKRPQLTLSEFKHYPLVGLYNKYNTLAAVLLAQKIGIEPETINSALQKFKPAFGRQEKLEVNGRTAIIFLSKNPTSFNESLRTVNELNGKHLLFVLNDRIPDGRDVSWIWDIDFETLLNKNQHIHVSGDRAYDMGLRLKYAHPTVKHVDTYPVLEKLFEPNVFDNLKDGVPSGETLYILPTYSAMLEVRKLITGRKIL